MLCLMHESERRGVLTLNGLPMPEDALSRLLGLDVDLVKQIVSKLEAHGVASREQDTGALFCRRMVRDEYIRQIRQESGKKGGNPILLKQNTKQNTTTQPNQNPTPSSSSSSSDIPPTPKGDSFVEKQIPSSQEAKRIAELFGRKSTTGWDGKEIRKFRELLPFDADDFDLVERYYLANKSNPNSYLRRDLCTFLNNYRGEVDRAREWEGKRSSGYQEEYKTPQIG